MKNSSDNTPIMRDAVIGGSCRIGISHRRTHIRTIEMHSHDFCELTVYTEGGKSVFVDNSIYVSPTYHDNGVGGCAFTFRPHEFHAGLHEPDSIHERYVLTFAPDCFTAFPGGDALLACFFARNAGEHNMIVMPPEETKRGFALLDAILDTAQTDNPAKEALMLAYLIEYLTLLNAHYMNTAAVPESTAAGQLRGILSYIDAHLGECLTVRALCTRFGISISTMERMFSGLLKITPKQYIRLRRLEASKQLLRAGASVTEACYEVGFSDVSHYIKDFRRQFGITPLGYRQQ